MANLVMLLQAAVSIANTERWALELEETSPPAQLAGLLRTTAYEVAVVDRFHLIARRYFERAHWRAIWERPFKLSGKGRPKSVDVALFNDVAKEELRIELGLYTPAKLHDDAKKLSELKPEPLPGYPTVRNLVMLWAVRSDRLANATATKWMHDFKDAAASAATPVKPLLASCVDLFAARPGECRYVVVGLFEA